MMFFVAIIAILATRSQAALKFDSSTVGTNGFTGEILSFKGRMYVPYGPNRHDEPNQDPSDQPWTGYGYGLGATEHWAYDYKERYIYSQSESGGYITVIDYSADAFPGQVTELSVDVAGPNVDIRDVVVCPEEGLLFMTVSDRDKVLMYETVKRSDPKIPTLIEEIEVGNTPDALKLSNDCSVLAVANQNEGDSIIEQGALTIITNFRDSAGPIVRRVHLNGFDDDYLLSRDVHMPMTKNSMTYWNNREGYGWEVPGGILERYTPAIAMDPEFIAFSHDGSEIFLNLQDNSALVRIRTETGEVLSVNGYGLKPMTTDTAGADIINDKECKLVTNDCLYLGRTPDAIAAVLYDDTHYVLTADEGSDFSFEFKVDGEDEEWEEKYDSQDLFLENGTFAIPDFTFSDGFLGSCTANFAADCETNPTTTWCSNFEITIGTSAVNYDNQDAPFMDKIVGFGGRGFALFKLDADPAGGIDKVWDTESDFEQETCSNFAWANNAVMDEEFAPICTIANEQVCPRWTLSDEDDRSDIEARNLPPPDGIGCIFADETSGACPLEETVDEKAEEDGLAVESVVVGVACGRLFALGCGENNGICLLYDITNIESKPELLKSFPLSPANREKNPDQSYRDDMGDLDSETIVFVSPEQSPTGNAGLIFGGAISGTLSFYEFECMENPNDSSSSPKSFADGATASIMIGGVVSVILAGFL